MGGSNKLSKISADEARIIDGCVVVSRKGRETMKDHTEGQGFSRNRIVGDVLRSLEAPMDRLDHELRTLGCLTNSLCCQAEELDEAILSAKKSISTILLLMDSVNGLPMEPHEGWVELSIVDFLRDIADQLQPELDAAGVELKENYWPAPLTVKCCSEEISLAVRSLLIHAVESASMSSSIGLDWEAWVGLEVRYLGQEVEIVVSNSGVGEAGRVFEPTGPHDQGAFDSVQGALFRRELTLGAARRVASSHHGALEERHGPHGSQVIIRLPLENGNRLIN